MPAFYKRGELWLIETSLCAPPAGHEIAKTRPAIVVSADDVSDHSRTVAVVYLTTQPKPDSRYNVPIHSALKDSTALCQQPTSVDVRRMSRLLGHCTPEEMAAIDKALAFSLGLRVDPAQEREKDCAEEIQKLHAQIELLRSVYEDALRRSLS